MYQARSSEEESSISIKALQPTQHFVVTHSTMRSFSFKVLGG
jgi:hypothetical protein